MTKLQQAYARWVNTFWMVRGITNPMSLPLRLEEREKAWEEYVSIRDQKPKHYEVKVFKN